MASVTYGKCIMANVIIASVIMASVTYGKCYLWQMYYGKCNYGKCNYGKNIYGKNILQMKLSPSFMIRYTSIKNHDRCESGVPLIQILFNNGLVLNRFSGFIRYNTIAIWCKRI